MPRPVSRQLNSNVMCPEPSEIARQPIVTEPPAGVNFTALKTRLIQIRRRCLQLPITRHQLPSIRRLINTPCLSAIGCVVTTSSSISSEMSKDTLSSRSPPESNLLMSSTSFTSSRSVPEIIQIFSRQYVCRCMSFGARRATSTKPRMPLMGVLTSWLICRKNCILATAALFAASAASRSCFFTAASCCSSSVISRDVSRQAVSVPDLLRV